MNPDLSDIIRRIDVICPSTMITLCTFDFSNDFLQVYSLSKLEKLRDTLSAACPDKLLILHIEFKDELNEQTTYL